MSHYIVTYYFPAGMFVIVSWISFLVPPESVPGRMTILVTVFLVLVNIFNSITSNIPRADGLTAIESFIIICIVFVFGALIGSYWQDLTWRGSFMITPEYAVILFSLKIKTSRPPQFRKGNMRSVQEVQSAFMRMDVNGDGSLTKREMLAADEFTPEEVNYCGNYGIIWVKFWKCSQIEAIFDLGDVDGDGTIDMDEFVGKRKHLLL